MKHKDAGIVLVSVMILVAVLLMMVAMHYRTTKHETANAFGSRKMSTGFYSAEAGLNLRADNIRQIFVGYNQPNGTAPNTGSACKSGNIGSGDFACQTYTLNKRQVVTYVVPDEDNPIATTVPQGEVYQNLSTQEYNYTTYSEARDSRGRVEAKLAMKFTNRLVPLFQFAAFFNKDLEIIPGANMTLSGPVYTNGDLYINSNGAVLTIKGQVVAAGDIYRGRKDNQSPQCNSNSVKVNNAANTAKTLIGSCSSRYKVKDSDIKSWNGMIQQHVQAVTVPAPEALSGEPGATYFNRADLRVKLVLKGDNSFKAIEVRTPQNTLDENATQLLNNSSICPGNRDGHVAKYAQFWNSREEGVNQVLDIDMAALLKCLGNTNWFGTGKRLSDDTDGGLVFHFTVEGPRSNYQSSLYAVRLGNASNFQVTSTSVKGLTVATDQGAYTWGNYNSTNKIPAAILADTVHVVSSNWKDANCGLTAASCPLSKRKAVATTVNAALLLATNTTGGLEGSSGQGGGYNGGYENSIRFQENWSGITFTYNGSIVSLNTPRHSAGAWGKDNVYDVPNRNWSYDTSFNSAENLPPLTPRFVYLRQELFERKFQQDQ